MEELEHSSGSHRPSSQRKGEWSDSEEFTDDGYVHFKVNEWKKALEKLKADKKTQSGMTIVSPFLKTINESPLPNFYRMNNDLMFDEISDPVEYLSHFDTKMEV